jgi:hypothetical protein
LLGGAIRFAIAPDGLAPAPRSDTLTRRPYLVARFDDDTSRNETDIRAICRRSPTAMSGHPVAGHGRVDGLVVAVALALSACSGGHLRGEGGSGGPRPENYKSDILAMLHVYFRDPTQIRDAGASEPKLLLVGQRNRYVVCLRLNAKKSDGEYAGTKQYLAVFSGGRLDQMVEAKPEDCAGAEYRPFPEAETLSR